MFTFYSRIADLIIKIEANEQTTLNYFTDYMIDSGNPDMTIKITEKELREAENGEHNRSYLEFLAICRHICAIGHQYDLFLLHAATIEVDQVGYAFFAPSGTGKSTHIRLWRQLLGNRCHIVNGDKPFIRRLNGKFYAYGTPWCGKERWQRNVRVPLGALCRLTRGDTDSIKRLSVSESVPHVLNQIALPSDNQGIQHILDLADNLLKSVPVFSLACTPNLSAAQTAYEILSKSEGV